MVHFVAWLSVMLFFFRYVFTGSNNEKLPLEKRDSIISEKKISPNGQGGLYFGLLTKKKMIRKNRAQKRKSIIKEN